MKKYVITSESVCEGHPDKICDAISDAILDTLLTQDPDTRAGIECLAADGNVIVAGEVTSKGFIDAQRIARETLKEIGYTDPKFGISYEDCGVLIGLHEQSPDIAQGVNTGTGEDKEQGAGDQGMMYGYACDETEEFMPLPIILAHKLVKRLSIVRKTGIIQGLGPDGKAQVSVEYVDDKPKKITSVVVANQHLEEYPQELIGKEIYEKVVKPVCGEYMTEDTKVHINATGKFIIGGPKGDAGLTGRKIIVDTYGGVGRHGGGAFSGKDPSKVDRSGAYMARYAAKNIVASGVASKCEIMVSYCIGISRPTSVYVNCFGTNKIPEEKIQELVLDNFNFSPSAMIKTLQLKKPIYKKTAAFGHFGRNEPEFLWEKTDKSGIFRAYLDTVHKREQAVQEIKDNYLSGAANQNSNINKEDNFDLI